MSPFLSGIIIPVCQGDSRPEPSIRLLSRNCKNWFIFMKIVASRRQVTCFQIHPRSKKLLNSLPFVFNNISGYTGIFDFSVAGDCPGPVPRPGSRAGWPQFGFRGYDSLPYWAALSSRQVVAFRPEGSRDCEACGQQAIDGCSARIPTGELEVTAKLAVSSPSTARREKSRAHWERSDGKLDDG